MRRLGKIVALLVLSLLLTPRPAAAYFWAWLDDWSGPRFMGTEAEWRVWCQSEQPWENRALLLSVHRRIQVEAAQYRRLAGQVNPNRDIAREFDRAVEYADVADRFMGLALHPTADGTQKNRVALRAVAWRAIAAAQFTWARDLRDGKTPDLMKKPEQPDLPPKSEFAVEPATRTETLADFEKLFLLPAAVMPVGVVFSTCNAAPLQRERQFVSLKFGWAFDAKDRNEVFDHRMMTIGASYNVVATPFLTVGTGAGLAVLTSKVREPLYKFYVNPTIVDFRPGALGRNGRSRGPWFHVFFLRYSTMVVPTGFDPGSFGGQTERYSAELTNTVGLHADLTPVIRKLQGRW